MLKIQRNGGSDMCSSQIMRHARGWSGQKYSSFQFLRWRIKIVNAGA